MKKWKRKRRNCKSNQTNTVCCCRTSHLCLLPDWAEWGKWNQQAGMWAVGNQVSPPFPYRLLGQDHISMLLCLPTILPVSLACPLSQFQSNSLCGVLFCYCALHVPVSVIQFGHQSEDEWNTIWCITNKDRLKFYTFFFFSFFDYYIALRPLYCSFKGIKCMLCFITNAFLLAPWTAFMCMFIERLTCPGRGHFLVGYIYTLETSKELICIVRGTRWQQWQVCVIIYLLWHCVFAGRGFYSAQEMT